MAAEVTVCASQQVVAAFAVGRQKVWGVCTDLCVFNKMGMKIKGREASIRTNGTNVDGDKRDAPTTR